MRVQVTTTRPQRWRAGILFTSAESKILDIETLSEEQKKAIEGDPALSVGPAPDEDDDTSSVVKGQGAKASTKSAKAPGK